MAYSVSGLSNYTIENPDILIWEKIYSEGDTLKLITNKQTGVKSAEKIAILSTRGYWQTQGCSFTASGDTTFTQATLTVGKVAVNMSFCERDLEPKYTQLKLQAGGNYTDMAFYNQIVDLVLANINADLETAIWKGDTTLTGNPFLKHFDGLVKQINAASGTTTISGTAWSSANSRTVIQALNASVAANVAVYKTGTTLKYFMSPAMALAYRQKLITDNLYHINANTGGLVAEGTNIPIVEVAGLAGLNYIYAVETDNIYFGCDMLNEEEKVDFWMSKDDQNMKLHVEFKAAVNVAHGQRCFQYLGV